MDKKDQIILQQLDVIRSMTENNVRRMGSDFWGTPFQDVGKAPAAPGKPAEPEKPVPPTADAKPGDAAPEKAEELPPPEKIEDLLAELDTYIGLNVVKDEVHDLINMVQVYKLREQHDLPTTDMSLHMVFTGNPGTGKTMMARMMARIYRSLGILSKGQLVEVDRSGLVAGYVGQTALKTQKVIERAMGGVLFIDEAYALNGKSENDFGQEAIDTILKAMEDHRDDLVVIVAGYTELMDKFIHSNPGLESRFNRFLLFEDYTPEEMFEIFKMRCGKGYVLAPEAEPLVRDYIAEESADPSFGNARGVRNLFEHILVAQNNRLAKMPTVTREDLMTITPDDVLHARGKLDDRHAKKESPYGLSFFVRSVPLFADPRHAGDGQDSRHGVDTHARVKGLGRTLGLVRLGVGGGVVVVAAGGGSRPCTDYLGNSRRCRFNGTAFNSRVCFHRSARVVLPNEFHIGIGFSLTIRLSAGSHIVINSITATVNSIVFHCDLCGPFCISINKTFVNRQHVAAVQMNFIPFDTRRITAGHLNCRISRTRRNLISRYD